MRQLTEGVKYILMANVLMFFLSMVYDSINPQIPLFAHLGLFYFESDYFKIYQYLTHMFMHANFSHLFFNMFALFMFGFALERVWGRNRFFLYYFVCGFGAAIIHTLFSFIQYHYMGNADVINIPTIGASGAVFGVLLAFGMLFPNTELYLMLIPIPVKAKYAVIGYGVLELFLGTAQFSGDNVAHFAHLGGMLFGFLLIKYWEQDRNKIY